MPKGKGGAGYQDDDEYDYIDSYYDDDDDDYEDASEEESDYPRKAASIMQKSAATKSGGRGMAVKGAPAGGSALAQSLFASPRRLNRTERGANKAAAKKVESGLPNTFPLREGAVGFGFDTPSPCDIVLQAQGRGIGGGRHGPSPGGRGTPAAGRAQSGGRQGQSGGMQAQSGGRQAQSGGIQSVGTSHGTSTDTVKAGGASASALRKTTQGLERLTVDKEAATPCAAPQALGQPGILPTASSTQHGGVPPATSQIASASLPGNPEERKKVSAPQRSEVSDSGNGRGGEPGTERDAKGEARTSASSLQVGPPAEPGKPKLHMVVVGHVDAGKSTLMGRLLYELGIVSEKEVQKQEREAAQAGKASFSWAWASR
eukprot:jgi/Botrbrau1/387/Bobra.110_2s0042.1